jgi:ribosomal-protein-alanine N-acetyltransferase
MHCVETARLLLRPFQHHGDGEGLFSVVGNDPDMTWDHSTRQLDMVTRTAADRAKHFDEHDFGVWAVVEKESASMIGQCGLQRLPESEKIEIVVYTAKRLWRSGYAYEACVASLRYGFEVLKKDEILAVVRLENESAKKLMLKLGFTHLRFDHLYETEVEVFVIKRENFFASLDDLFIVRPCPRTDPAPA